MKTAYAVVGAASGALLFAHAASAETVLRVSSWAPPTHFVNAKIWPEWGRALSDATEGRVRIKLEYNLASPLKQFGVARDGIADASWIFHGYNTRYVATQIVEMPNLGTSAEAAAVAYWQVHQKHLYKANEHRGVVLIGLQSHGPAVIQTKKPLRALADLRGMKIRVPGGVGSLVGKALGVTAVKLPAPKVYEALSSGVADGIFMPIETQKGFRLKEVTRHVLIMPGGLYYGSFAFLLNPRSFKKLSADDQAALMSVSGEGFARLGKYWDEGDADGLAAARQAGTSIRTASAEMKAAFLKIMKPVEEAWIERAARGGYDPRAALAELRATARAYDKKMMK